MCGIGEGRDPGEMKAIVCVFTTVYHGRGVWRSTLPSLEEGLRRKDQADTREVRDERDKGRKAWKRVEIGIGNGLEE